MVANPCAEGSPTLVELLQCDGRQALAELFRQHHPHLVGLVRQRLDPRLAGRIDPDDVLQEAYLDAAARLDHYLALDHVPPLLWIKMVVGQTLVNVHRRHLATKKRDAGREVAVTDAISFAGSSTARPPAAPDQAAMRSELHRQVVGALDAISSRDRQILVLRHFEGLSNREVAERLGIQQKAASIRYVRAIGRLKGILQQRRISPVH